MYYSCAARPADARLEALVCFGKASQIQMIRAAPAAVKQERVTRTDEDRPPFALLLHAAVLLPRQRVRSLEHEAVYVVALLEVRLLLRRLLLLEVWLDERHLDVGEAGVQLFGVHLDVNRGLISFII